MKEIKNRLSKMSDENDKLKKIVAEKELKLAILREIRNKVNPAIALKVHIATKWINKGYKTSIVLDFDGLNFSTYYSNMNRYTEKH